MAYQNKVAIVTGAAGQGMGRSIALTLAREHAAVVVNYRTNQGKADELVAHIQACGGTAIAVQADIFNPEGCQTLVRVAQDWREQIDICVINPGGGWHAEPPDQLDPEAALADIRQEVAPCLYLLPLILPMMYKRQWGRIIALTSNPHLPSPALAYNVAKAARAELLLQAQNAAWGHGVTINVIAPGPVSPIPSLAEAIEQCDHGPAWQTRKTASPQDIAESVAFLCSDAGQFITGCTLPYQFRG